MNKYAALLLAAVLLLGACAAPTTTNAPALPVATSTTSALPAEPAAAEPTSTFVAPEVGVPSPDRDLATANAGGRRAVDQAVPSPALETTATGILDAAEIEGILYMREEEKLARDVYLALYEAWGVPIFQNIASSEATHMEAVRTLIERYDLEDPAAGNDAGVFANETLQGLYDRLVAEGSQSLGSALQVGAAIEEIDILDLEEHLAHTDKADIQRVYQNLSKGSRNHLRAFVSNLDRRTGETYQPQYLSREAYEAVVSADTEKGRRN